MILFLFILVEEVVEAALHCQHLSHHREDFEVFEGSEENPDEVVVVVFPVLVLVFPLFALFAEAQRLIHMAFVPGHARRVLGGTAVVAGVWAAAALVNAFRPRARRGRPGRRCLPRRLARALQERSQLCLSLGQFGGDIIGRACNDRDRREEHDKPTRTSL